MQTIDILRQQIAELKELIALKDQRIAELSLRPTLQPANPYPQIQPANPFPWQTNWYSVSST